tara:strand:- start:913 stop:1539 length:627 start_codon:yes stop_codon:yes gene_type:complete
MKIVELLIDELDKLSGVDTVALVEEPAIEADFYAFNEVDVEDTIALQLIKLALKEEMDSKKKLEETKSPSKFSFALQDDQQIIVGPLMIPNKLILRVDENDEPYYIFFSKDTIRQVAYKMMKNKFIDALNTEHDPDQPVNGHLLESWIVEDSMNDKQNVYGFNFEEGSWMGMYKVESSETWSKIKAGDIKGFSVEGFFTDRFVQAKAQ